MNMLVETLFEAQSERDRINHINQMAYNSKILTISLLALSAQVEQFHPYLQDELLGLLKRHHDSTELMRQCLEKHSIIRGGVSPSNTGGRGATFSSINGPAPDLNQPHHRHNQQEQRDERPGQQQAAPAAGAPVAAAPRAPAGVAARVPRVAALIVIDVRLLFKLALVVAFLGHDAGPREFYVILLIAVVVYLANTNMIRMPLFARMNLGGIGRIPHADRRGFFVDVWTMISSVFLSIIPAWQVVGEDIPVDQQQVRPIAGADQPNVVAPAMAVGGGM
jgi:hypothetical protein